MKHKSHWSFDTRAASVQRRHNRARERKWRNDWKGVHTPTTRERLVKEVMQTYSCNETVAIRVLDLLTER